VIELIVEKIAELIAGDPKAPRWAYVTALCGWFAAVALLVWSVVTILGLSVFASQASVAFSFLLSIALSLDWSRLRKR